MGLKMGFTIEQYSCMPIGELNERILFYMASEGHVTVKKDYNNEEFIPRLK